MNAFLNHWMPVLRRRRAWLMLSLFLCMGAGWYLTLPTVPLASWHAGGPIQYLGMVSPHTLLVSTAQQAKLYPDLDAAVHPLITYHGVLYGLHWRDRLVAVSADGQWLAVATSLEQVVSDVQDGMIEVWFIPEQRLLAQIPVPLRATHEVFQGLTMSADGKRIGWSTHGDGVYRQTLTIWDRPSQRVVLRRTLDNPQAFVLLSWIVYLTDTNGLIGYIGNNNLEVHQVYTDDHIATIPLSEGEMPLSMSPDGSLVTLYNKASIIIRRLQGGQLVRHLPFQHFSLQSSEWHVQSTFSLDERYILLASAFTEGPTDWVFRNKYQWNEHVPAVLWDVNTGQVVQRFDVQPNGALLVAYSPDGQYVATARDDEVRVFRVSPQLPFLQPLCVLASLALAVLLFWQWLWARNYHASMKDEG